MIVRSVNLSIVVADVDAALKSILQVANDLGGFVVSSDSSESDDGRSGRATLRVPAGQLDEAVGRIKALAQRVPRENTATKDVTSEYVDQDARLRNLRATEAQYLGILKSAKTVEETLNVQKALSEVRDQIERTEARLQYLRKSVEMASISVDVTTSTAAQPLEWGDWNLLGTLRDAAQGLVNVVLFLVTLAIWLAVLAPIWVSAYLAFRWWRRRRARKSAPPSAK